MTLSRELEQLSQNEYLVIGVDEAGRGPLCGPVVAGACVYLSSEVHGELKGINDSKQINEEAREMLFEQIKDKMIYGVCEIDNRRIDEINILQATYEAMTGAVLACIDKLPKLHNKFHILVDGPKVPPQLSARFACTPVVRGDSREFIIAAASIVAKVTRDKLMMHIHNKFPVYNLAQHKGYPTAEHVRLVRLHGPCDFHRLSFAPLKFMTSFQAPKAAGLSSKAVKLAAPSKVVAPSKVAKAVAKDTTATMGKRKNKEIGLVETAEGLRRSARLRYRE